MLWIMVEVTHFDPSDTGDDQITWTQSTDGNYSAKSTYLMQCLVGALNPPFRRRFGMCGRRLGASSLCGSCFRIGCGQLIDCLPGNGYEYFYPLCYRNLETIKHLLLECQFSQRIWKEVSHCASLPSFDPLYWTPSWGVSKWFLTVAGLWAQRSIRVRDPSLSSFAGPCGKSEMQEFSNLKRRHSLGHYRKTTNLLGPKP
jgi:hypothetical protein